MKKPWFVTAFTVFMSLFLRCGIVARVGLVAAVFVGLFLFPAQAHAARTITAATPNGGSSVTVAPGATIAAVVNVTTTGTGSAARWRSTGWRISTTAPGAVTCVNHANHDSAGAYSEPFSITAPATSGTYNAYFIAYNNDSCSSGASATSTMMGAVIVAVTNPVPTTTSISPASKNVGDGAFTMTVNGTNFVSGSVVRFNGLDRTTTYVSATQLTASIPASDMTTVGTFNITAFNPTPGGGTSNAQTFTVTTAFPTATTNAASDVTTVNNGDSWAATLNGIVSSNGADTTVTFEYGLTAAYGTSIAATPGSLATGAVNTAVSATLDWWLNCNTTFHYRVKATNSAGTSYGLDSIFTTGSCPGAPFSATDCAATRFGSNLVCTANDVNLTGITVAPGSVSSCVSGTPVTLDIDMTVNFATPDRWDIGIFIANDGKLPTQLPANGGASSCTVDILPITPPAYGYKFPDLDGEPMGTSDTCGDGNSAINVGTGSGVKRMTGVTIPCYATPDSGGKLFVPFVVSWDNQKSPIGGVCTSNQYPVPNTTSKCNAPLSSVPINVVVLPKINKTHSGATFNPGDLITYTITVFNDSGGTLQASFFKDPAVDYLNVTDVSCAAAAGATCPGMPSPGMTSAEMKTAMQGPTGILIPSANLPNNSSLIFTVTGRLSGDIGQTISNTATVSIGLNTNTSTDSVTLGSASGSKSFSPAAITEDNNSLMTITFTNPIASAVTDVSFIDTYPAGLVNAASPNVNTTCGGTVTAIAGGLTFSGGTIPASGSCTVSVYVTSATANNYINSVSFLPGSLGSASATLSVTAPVFGAFNACDDAPDPNFSCTNATTPTTSRITTKIAGSPFTLDLVALKTDGSWNSSYSNDVIVELRDASNNSGALDANNCRSSWTLIATLGSFPDFGSSNGQITTLTSFTVQEAYRNVRVRVSNNGGTTRVGCSTDNFAIRPASFTLIAQDTNAETAGTARKLNTVDVNSGPVHKAGRPFIFTATAYNAAGTPAPTTYYVNTPGYPTMTPSPCTGSACTASFGIFSPGVTSFTAGTLSSNVASYSEVGSFNLTLQDTDFASVDAADTAATCAGYYVCSAATPVGRFVPDHFVLSGGYIANRTDLPGCAVAGCDTFTYMGELMSALFTLTAQAAGNTTTLNYVGASAPNDLARLNPAAVGNPLVIGAVDTGTSRTVATLDTTTYGVASGNFVSGVASVTVPFAVTRGASPSGPFDALSVGINPVDGDGVALATLDLAVNVGNTPMTHGLVGTTKARYGRMKLSNAHGSELLPLTIAVAAQYWNGTTYVTNTLDNNSTFAAANVVLSNPQKNLALNETSVATPPASVVFTGGVAGYRLDKPSGGDGQYDGSVDMSISAGANCSTAPTLGCYLPSNTARATFGVYKGNNQFIYLREMY